MVKKPYPPGLHGPSSKRRRKNISEYSIQMSEKQKLKFLYGLREKQFVNYIKEAMKKRGSASDYLSQFLESRLDNIVFRLGFTASRPLARQLVSHGHILVNGRKLDIPSYRVKIGDLISIREKSLAKKVFTDLDIKWKKFDPPSWLALDKKKHEGKVKSAAELESKSFNLNLIIELYSR